MFQSFRNQCFSSFTAELSGPNPSDWNIRPGIRVRFDMAKQAYYMPLGDDNDYRIRSSDAFSLSEVLHLQVYLSAIPVLEKNGDSYPIGQVGARAVFDPFGFQSDYDNALVKPLFVLGSGGAIVSKEFAFLLIDATKILPTQALPPGEELFDADWRHLGTMPLSSSLSQMAIIGSSYPDQGKALCLMKRSDAVGDSTGEIKFENRYAVRFFWNGEKMDFKYT